MGLGWAGVSCYDTKSLLHGGLLNLLGLGVGLRPILVLFSKLEVGFHSLTQPSQFARL